MLVARWAPWIPSVGGAGSSQLPQQHSRRKSWYCRSVADLLAYTGSVAPPIHWHQARVLGPGTMARTRLAIPLGQTPTAIGFGWRASCQKSGLGGRSVNIARNRGSYHSMIGATTLCRWIAACLGPGVTREPHRTRWSAGNYRSTMVATTGMEEQRRGRLRWPDCRVQVLEHTPVSWVLRRAQHTWSSSRCLLDGLAYWTAHTWLGPSEAAVAWGHAGATGPSHSTSPNRRPRRPLELGWSRWMLWWAPWRGPAVVWRFCVRTSVFEARPPGS